MKDTLALPGTHCLLRSINVRDLLCFARLTVKGCRCSARCEVGFYKFFGQCYSCDHDSWSYAWSIILVLMIVSAWWLINNVVCALIDSLAVRAALGASLHALPLPSRKSAEDQLWRLCGFQPHSRSSSRSRRWQM
jgi:hypothetical protein